jgi:DNA-binding winged helix-turn-helix (wHTH) protein
MQEHRERFDGQPAASDVCGETKDIEMRAHNTRHDRPDRMQSSFAAADTGLSDSRPAAMRLPDLSTRLRRHRSFVWSAQKPPALRHEMTDFLADVDGLPVVVRFLVKQLLAEMQSSFVSKGADIHMRLSSTLENMADRMRGSSPRSNGSTEQPPLQAPPNETVLSVGPLELDLIDRSAKRGDRWIDLRPREFQLLKYMMQRNGELLTRAILFKEVWNYKFVPESNLVDVHMGRLRRKIDGTDEAPMISNVRGAGFVLSAAPLSRGLPTTEKTNKPAPGRTAPQSAERVLQ